MQMPRDPRNSKQRQTNRRSAGRNTKSFNPSSTYGRPDVRIRVVNSASEIQTLSNDDVILFPKFLPSGLYPTLIDELNECEFKSWNEGCHTLTEHASESPTFNRIVQEMCAAFLIEPSTCSTRFNWFVDDKDWKSLHFDSAAFNKERAKVQNITVAVSIGGTREVVFEHASSGTKMYIPQPDGQLYTFGRDVNIRWQHGVNAIPEEKQIGAGRISIVLWGNAKNTDLSESALPLIDNRPTCRDFLKGECKYGTRCKFKHASCQT